MPQFKTKQRRAPWFRNRGVIMIEVALAIVVLAIGVLSVFALFNRGLEKSTRAMADTQAAMFADTVFEGLRAASLRAAHTGDTNAWERFWETFIYGTNTIPVAAQDVWRDVMVIQEGGLHTNVYRNGLLYGTGTTSIVNHTLRYRLDVSFFPPLGSRTNSAEVTLRVWPGEFGSTNTVPPILFYSEFRNPDFF